MLDPVAFSVGPFSIRWYAICIVTGLILAVYLAMKEAPRKKMIPDDILDFILIAFPLPISLATCFTLSVFPVPGDPTNKNLFIPI